MKKILTAIVFCPILMVNGVSANIQATTAEENQFANSFEKMIPTGLFGTSFTLAQIQYDIIGYVEKPINPFDPSFAQCMNTAIQTKNYQNALNATTKDYFSHVTKPEFKSDLIFLNSPAIIKETKKYNDLFTLFAKNKTLKQNQDIFYPRVKNKDDVSVVNVKPSDYLSSILTLHDKSPYGIYISNQINICHQQQKLS